MGCLCSKLMTRSMSFKEELSQSMQRKSNGMHDLEELFTSGNGNDQFLALVCTANTVAHKLRTRGFPLPSNTGSKSALEPTNTETINTWELMAGLEEQEVLPMNPMLSQSQKVGRTLDVNKIKRSKSCQCSPENEKFNLVPGFEELNEDGFQWGNKGIVRSRSFHTVEEYDAMVEKIWSSMAHKTGPDDDYEDIQETAQSFSKDEDLIRENNVKEQETKEVLPSLNSSSKIEETSVCERGLKRKAMAKGLESLKIPSTIEFPNISSLRQWLHVGGQVHSPGTYVTPKFGSYNFPNLGSRKECSEEPIFNPELVAAFEECMLQLEEEEQSLLKQIEGHQHREEDVTKEMDAKEEIPANIQDQDEN